MKSLNLRIVIKSMVMKYTFLLIMSIKGAINISGSIFNLNRESNREPLAFQGKYPNHRSEKIDAQVPEEIKISPLKYIANIF